MTENLTRIDEDNEWEVVTYVPGASTEEVRAFVAEHGCRVAAVSQSAPGWFATAIRSVDAMPLVGLLAEVEDDDAPREIPLIEADPDAAYDAYRDARDAS